MSELREEPGNEVDDAFRAVLEGLRTTLPGVQVLFAFLLVLPLQASFESLTGAEKVAYYAAFYGSALAGILLIAPSAHQRLRAPSTGVQRRSPSHLRMTVQMTNVGTVIFAIALSAATYLVSSLVLNTAMASIATAATAILLCWAWFYVPLVTFERGRDER